MKYDISSPHRRTQTPTGDLEMCFYVYMTHVYAAVWDLSAGRMVAICDKKVGVEAEIAETHEKWDVGG